MWGKKFVKLVLLFLVLFLGLISYVFESHGLLFRLELLLLFILLFVAFIIMLGVFVEEKWAWTMGFIFFAVVLINLLILKYFIPGNTVLFAVMVLFALIGFIKSISNMGSEPEQEIIPPLPIKEEKEKVTEKEILHIQTYHAGRKGKKTKRKKSPKKKGRKR